MPGDIDFKRIFDLSRTPQLVIDTDFRVLAANPAYAELAGRAVEDLLGHDVLSLHPDSPDRRSAGPQAIRSYWENVVATALLASLPLQRYDLLDPETGSFRERHWAMTTVSDLSADGEVVALVVHVEEVTSVAVDTAPTSTMTMTTNEQTTDRCHPTTGCCSTPMDWSKPGTVRSTGVSTNCSTSLAATDRRSNFPGWPTTSSIQPETISTTWQR